MSKIPTTPTRLRRPLQVLSAALLIVASAVLSLFTAGTASASTFNDTVMVQTQRMAAATLNSTQLGWYPSGSHLTLNCWVTGQAVKGFYSPYIPGGWDNLWYQTSDGAFVADIDLQTYTNGPAAGTSACAASPATSRGDKAVAWARSQVGSMAYPALCELFVEQAYNTSGRSVSAIAAYYSLKAAGQIHTNNTGIPAGALVFSSNPRYDYGNGHVMISNGDGTYTSGGVSTSLGNHSTVQILGLQSTYLGWAYAPDSWGSR